MAKRPSAPPPRRGRPVFRPRFSLSLLYTVFFFFLFALLLALPELLEAARSLPPGSRSEDLARGEQVARQALSGAELLLALGLALAATVLGARSGRLPGLRED